ncbi:hypothetical protein [Intrasporangium sp. YIM S08009]|uniref:hypothetical protein n=1 Tax=Intrasporangium zincisolvens TaxID=3080018 RepID=UPI002B05C190|nr:hypothetical protein [Intrasporangium sp. YIM S08009]
MDDDFGGPESHAGDAHRRRASHLYGLVVTGAVLATAPDDVAIRRVALLLLGTLAIYWVAETFVHWTATRTVLHRDLTRHEQQAVVLDGWPLVAASAGPVALLFLEAVLRVETGTAVNIALAATVVLLVVVGYQMGSTGGLRGVRLVGASLLVGLLGVAMIVLKTLLH